MLTNPTAIKRRSLILSGPMPVLLILLLFLFASGQLKAGGSPKTFPPQSTPFGKSYGDWAAEWWKWRLGIPASTSPVTDKTGAFGQIGQSGPVWFLTREDEITYSDGFPSARVERTCTVPLGKALFLVPMTDAWFSPEYDEFVTKNFTGNTLVEKQRAAAKFAVDHAQNMKVIVDGIEVPNVSSFRATTPEFTINLPQDNLLEGSPPAGPRKTVADGYWLMLEPLSEGKHKIETHLELKYAAGELAFAGISEAVEYKADVIYNLNVSSAVLNIEKAVALSWPVSDKRYAVESAEKVNGPWNVTQSAVSVVDNENRATVLSSSGAAFFRLRSLDSTQP